MYRTGHYGASLLAYAPVLAALLPVAPAHAVLGLVGTLAVATLPDVDHRLPLVPHRGPTHSLAFAGLVGGAFAAAVLAVPATAPLPARVPLAGFAFFVGAYGVVAHLLGDVLTPAGVAPFWPVSARRYSLSLARADSAVANYALLFLGVAATAGIYALLGPGV